MVKRRVKHPPNRAPSVEPSRFGAGGLPSAVAQFLVLVVGLLVFVFGVGAGLVWWLALVSAVLVAGAVRRLVPTREDTHEIHVVAARDTTSRESRPPSSSSSASPTSS